MFEVLLYVEATGFALLFFFSSRRRHTRSLCDWSSDVCSSDLGTCVRDYVHVLDLAQAHMLALEALDRLGSRKYNLGNGNGFTNLEMVEAARTITGHPIPHQIGPRRAGDPAILIASAAKIRAELGWSPQYPAVEQIIASAWEWHSRHPHGYQS